MLHTLPKLISNSKKRLGRGIGSGVGGHTVGKGNKGHNARQGKPTPLWFEGGQLPLIRRLPFLRGKLRFGSLNAPVQEVAVDSLAKLNGQDVTIETLLAAKLIKTAHLPAKIIGSGKDLKKVGEVRGIRVTAGAKKAIEAAGGSVVV